MTRPRVYVLLAAACALPRLAVLLHERRAVVTSFTPTLPSGTLFGVIYGQVISNQCNPITFNQFGVVGATVISGAIISGTYCINIVDEGFFKVSEDYVLQVSHP